MTSEGLCRDVIAAVLRIQNVYPGSRIMSFYHPGSDNIKEEGEKVKSLTFFVAINI
jgi:hypothetical protein